MKSESGTVSTPGYWNGRMAWDRADGKAARSPALSYSNSYKSWRISRLDGHLAYEITCDNMLPPTDRAWNVYEMGTPPAPKVVIHYSDPRKPCPKPNVVFVLSGPGAGKGTMCDIVVRLLKDTMEHVTRTTGKRNFLLDGFPRSLSNLEAWYEVFGRDTELPKMVYFECPFDVLEQRILGRAIYSGRGDDNIESMKLRFNTFKAETLPTVEFFRQQGKCAEVDTSQDRQSVYNLLRENLAEYTDPKCAAKPLTEKAEILLGLRPYPSRV